MIGAPAHLAVMRQLGNGARIVVCHGADDDVCLTEQKRAMVGEMHTAGLTIEPHWIDTAMVDGTVIKNSGHGVGDRTEIVHRFAGKYFDPASPDCARRSGPTDFALRDSAVVYPTPNGRYVISYEAGYPIGRFEASGE